MGSLRARAAARRLMRNDLSVACLPPPSEPPAPAFHGARPRNDLSVACLPPSAKLPSPKPPPPGLVRLGARAGAAVDSKIVTISGLLSEERNRRLELQRKLLRLQDRQAVFERVVAQICDEQPRRYAVNYDGDGRQQSWTFDKDQAMAASKQTYVSSECFSWPPSLLTCQLSARSEDAYLRVFLTPGSLVPVPQCQFEVDCRIRVCDHDTGEELAATAVADEAIRRDDFVHRGAVVLDMNKCPQRLSAQLFLRKLVMVSHEANDAHLGACLE